MADRLMDLQHHLVGHQQQIAGPGRTIGRHQQLQRLAGDSRAAAEQAACPNHLQATLLTEPVVLPGKRAGLRQTAVGSRHLKVGLDKLARLSGSQLPVDIEPLFAPRDAQTSRPGHDAGIGMHRIGLLSQHCQKGCARRQGLPDR